MSRARKPRAPAPRDAKRAPRPAAAPVPTRHDPLDELEPVIVVTSFEEITDG